MTSKDDSDIIQRKKERVDKWKLEQWLRKTRLDDGDSEGNEIKDLGKKSRVLGQMAEGMRKTNPLPKGRCNCCGNYEDRLAPLVVSCCKNCAQRFLKNGGSLKIMKQDFRENYCDMCFGKSWRKITINPFMCQKCAYKMARRYKSEAPDVRKQVGIINRRRPQSLKVRF
jgi:hypothetical protein